MSLFPFIIALILSASLSFSTITYFISFKSNSNLTYSLFLRLSLLSFKSSKLLCYRVDEDHLPDRIDNKIYIGLIFVRPCFFRICYSKLGAYPEDFFSSQFGLLFLTWNGTAGLSRQQIGWLPVQVRWGKCSGLVFGLLSAMLGRWDDRCWSSILMVQPHKNRWGSYHE